MAGGHGRKKRLTEGLQSEPDLRVDWRELEGVTFELAVDRRWDRAMVDRVGCPANTTLVEPAQRLGGGGVVGVELHRSMAARIAELEEWIGVGVEGEQRPLLMFDTGTRDTAKMVRDKVVTGGKVLWVVASGGSTLDAFSWYGPRQMVVDATKEFTEYEHSPSIWSRTGAAAKVAIATARLSGTPRDMDWNASRADVVAHVSGGMVMFWSFSGVDDGSRAREQLRGVRWELLIVPGGV